MTHGCGVIKLTTNVMHGNVRRVVVPWYAMRSRLHCMRACKQRRDFNLNTLLLLHTWFGLPPLHVERHGRENLEGLRRAHGMRLSGAAVVSVQ